MNATCVELPSGQGHRVPLSYPQATVGECPAASEGDGGRTAAGQESGAQGEEKTPEDEGV